MTVRTKVTEFTTGDYGNVGEDYTVLVEAYDTGQGTGLAGRGSGAANNLKEALDSAIPVITSSFSKLEAIGPDEITLSLGIKLTTGFQAIVAASSGEANIAVELTWKRD